MKYPTTDEEIREQTKEIERLRDELVGTQQVLAEREAELAATNKARMQITRQLDADLNKLRDELADAHKSMAIYSARVTHWHDIASQQETELNELRDELASMRQHKNAWRALAMEYYTNLSYENGYDESFCEFARFNIGRVKEIVKAQTT